MSKAIRFPESAIADGRVGTARIREEISCAAARLASTDTAPLNGAIKTLVVGSDVATSRFEMEIANWAHTPIAKRRSKFGNRQTVVDGIAFDSKREADRYCTLVLREKAGEICNLRLQVPFVVIEATTIQGKPVRECVYVADFVYEMPRGSIVVEDAKGMRTQVYRIKRKLMKVVHDIEIQEI